MSSWLQQRLSAPARRQRRTPVQCAFSSGRHSRAARWLLIRSLLGASRALQRDDTWPGARCSLDNQGASDRNNLADWISVCRSRKRLAFAVARWGIGDAPIPRRERVALGSAHLLGSAHALVG